MKTIKLKTLKAVRKELLEGISVDPLGDHCLCPIAAELDISPNQLTAFKHLVRDDMGVDPWDTAQDRMENFIPGCSRYFEQASEEKVRREVNKFRLRWLNEKIFEAKCAKYSR